MTSYKPQLPAYDDQRLALKKMRGREAFALLMAMRKGKTKVLLDDFGEMELAGEVSDLLVEAPGGVYRTWEEAVRTHCSEDLLERAKICVWASGPGSGERKRLAAFLALQDPRIPRILLVNAEAMSRPGDARTLVKEYLNQRSNVMAIDESTLNKNPQAKRTKFNNAVLRPLARYRRILSGLVAPRDPLDVFSQFEFLDWEILGFKSFYAFRAHFAVITPMRFGGRWVQVVTGFKNEAEIKSLIEPHSYRSEFRPLVPSTYDTWRVEMTREQRRIYEEVKADACSRLDAESHVSATVVITQMLRLHQVLCGHVVDDAGRLHEIPENRTAALLELLEDYSGKAIVWCAYDHDVRKVAAALEKQFNPNKLRGFGLDPEAPVAARFWGGNVATREAEEKRFKADPECRFMVATPGAGGKGRTWDAADLVINYSYTNNLEHADQSEQRSMGVTKDRGVDNVHLICEGTVERPILEALRKKIDMVSTINGDEYRRWLI